MALILDTPFNGFTASYWKITKTVEDAFINETYVEMSLYKDQATREANIKTSLTYTTFRFPAVDLTRADIYGLIKKLDDWKDAKDDQVIPQTDQPGDST